MLITIENFGAIKYFQFDTEKDLYLIFGKNSVGKSYAISLVYLILKNILISSKEEKEYGKGNFPSYSFMKKIENDIGKLKKKLEDNCEERIDISDYIEKKLGLHFNFFVEKLNNSLKNTFGDLYNLQNNFTKNRVKITIGSMCSEMVLKLAKSEFKISQYKINKKVFLTKGIVNNFDIFETNNTEIIIFLEKEDDYFKSYFAGIIQFFISIFFETLKEMKSIYYLPASRSGLYQALSAFGQIIVELAKNRSLISKSIEIPAISEPVADYFLHLSSITPAKKLNSDFIDYVNEIEKNILQGIVSFDNDSKKLLFTPNNTSLKLDLSSTSSMVSEISPITSYIKYIFTINRSQKVEQKPLVFIEEPEAHLHPETQVKLMTVFAQMAKDNKIKLVITSHSNYIFNKASNLVMDNKIDKEKFSAVLFELTPEGSVAKILETDEYGIEDENFIDTAESIYEEKIDLINKLNG